MKKILLADDDELMGDMYKTLLTLEKYDVTLVDNAEEIVKKAQKLNPALIILDVMMPKINGLEILKKLKKNPKTKHIQVLMLSNLSSPEKIEHALSLGAVKYLVKSDYLPKEVSKIVKDLLST